jgi:hypothetical protein
VFTATAEDLGLTEVDVRELSGGGPDPTTLWTSNDGETWSMTELDLSYVNNVFDTGGELIAAGFGRSGAEIWTSPDGFEWTRESSTKSEFLARWRDGFVAGIEGPATGVSYSEDLSDWVSLGLAAYLGDDLSWQVNSLAASEGGVAVALWGYDEGGSFTGDPEPVAIDKGVYTLTVDSSNGSTTLTSGNDILMRLHSFSDQIQDDLEIDFPSETVTFLRPDTGEPLVTFTFDELDQAQADSYGNQSLASDQDQFIAYTSDGETWSIQSVADAFGEDIRIVQVHVTNEQVVVVGARATEAFLRVPTVPDLLTWTAVIP